MNEMLTVSKLIYTYLMIDSGVAIIEIVNIF